MGIFMLGLFSILIVLIICGAILFSKYMELCSDNRTKMFENPRYDERIRELEKFIISLDKRIKELEEK